jgi:hypothetical protein
MALADELDVRRVVKLLSDFFGISDSFPTNEEKVFAQQLTQLMQGKASRKNSSSFADFEMDESVEGEHTYFMSFHCVY